MTIRGVEVYDVDKMEEFVKNNKVDVAILTLPRSQASNVANDLAEWGIKAFGIFPMSIFRCRKTLKLKTYT